MANQVFNIAKGRVAELHSNVKNNTPAASVLRVFAFVSAGADPNAIRDADTISALKGVANMAEATNTGYASQVLTDADIAAITTDDVNDKNICAIPQITFTSVQAGDNWTHLVIAYDPDGTNTDANTIPLTIHDFNVTPDGSNIVVSPGNYYEAS